MIRLNNQEEIPPEWRKFRYKGFSLDELKKMTLDELSKHFPARIRRSLERGLTPEQRRFLNRLKNEDGPIRTHVRDIPILPVMVGRTLLIHNGDQFRSVEVTPEMIGNYLGDFAYTNEKVKHSKPGMGATRSSKFLSQKK